MATNSVRGPFKTKLIALLQGKEAVNGVQISYGFPGDKLEQDAVYTATCIGRVEITLMQGGRKQRDDNFDLTVVVLTGQHGLTPEQGEARAAVLLSAIEDVFADDPTLGLSGDGGVVAAEISSIDGPNTTLTREGAVSHFIVTISVHARYS